MDDMGRQAVVGEFARWQLRYAGLLAAVTQTDDRIVRTGLQRALYALPPADAHGNRQVR
ncbi:MAG: hypothetical protein R3E79_46950 [Caldilineaceae bacterium]